MQTENSNLITDQGELPTLPLIPNPLSNAQKTGFSEKPVFYSCKGQEEK